MKIIYGICSSCEHVGEYTAQELRKPDYVRCRKCKCKKVWRIYTSGELDQMREGERVE